MSLTRKLMLAVTLLVLVLLVGNLLIGLGISRDTFTGQLQTLTEDTATSLGFSLSRVDLESDTALVQSMVDAIFDRGYYRSIVVTDTDNHVVVARSRDIIVEGVPSWFIDFVELPQHAGIAEVVAGWYRKGEVSVIAHPGYLYDEMWQLVKEQLWLLLFVAVLAYGMAGLGLKHILAPLTAIRMQAESIAQKDFVEQSKIPQTMELKLIVESMNYMVRKIRDMYRAQVDLSASLREQVSMDELTELPNREEFDRQFASWLESQQGDGPGALVLLQVSNIGELNNGAGREQVNTLLCGLADLFRQALGAWPRALACRRTGSDFAIFIPGLLLGELEVFLRTIDQQIDELMSNLSFEEAEIYLGAAGSSAIDNQSNLLSAADAVLRQAKEQLKPRWHMDSADSKAIFCLTSRAWVDRIKKSQIDNSLFFEYQDVFNAEKGVIHQEGFARIEEDGKVINAGVFWPVAERFHLVEELDKHMLGLAHAAMEKNEKLRLAINLSPASVKSAGFRHWLAKFLAGNAHAERLSLELPERILKMREEDLEALLNITQKYKVKVGLDHFGLVPSAFGSLQKLALNYVKIDRQFIQDPVRQEYYLKMLCQIAQACDVDVIIEGVESEEQWEAAIEMGAAGAQGYWLSWPKNLS